MTTANTMKFGSQGAELAFVASCIKDSKVHPLLREVDPLLFEDETCQAAAVVLKKMVADQTAIDVSTFEAVFREQNQSLNCGEILNFTFSFKTPSMAGAYLKVLQGAKIRRKLVSVRDYIDRAIINGENIEAIMGCLASSFKEVENLKTVVTGQDKITDIMNRVTNRICDDSNGMVHYTGLESADQHGGYRDTFMMVGARYGIGKTPFLIRLAYHNAVIERKPVAMYWGENSAEDIILGMISMMTGIELKRLKVGLTGLSKIETQLITDAQQAILDSPLYFLPSKRRLSFFDMKSEFRKLKEKFDFKIAIIDQFSSIIYEGPYRNKVDNMNELANLITDCWTEMPGFWLIAAQLKTKGMDNRPTMYDTMGFSELEQNVEVGLVLDRPEKEKRRVDIMKKEMQFRIGQIKRDKDLNQLQKASQIMRIERENQVANKARLYQDKGRGGYGEWEEHCDYDENALGYFCPNVIPAYSPLAEKFIMMQRREEQLEHDTTSDSSDDSTSEPTPF